ncbi:MAG: hypothetical protein KJI72_01480 [Patescibacteria group bacterium]|nr:hypothetical protein [Patescibacteria group bacterium]
MKFIIPKKPLLLVLLAFLILDGLLLVFLLQGKAEIQIPKNLSAALTNSYPEIADLKDKQLSFKDLSNYFSDLAEEKDAVYAYEVLKVAPIPPGIDMHLMGHVVGDILYRQQGVRGIGVCTHDFRNACSHSIVVGLLLEGGEGAIPEITEACGEAPGGTGAYSMCFHGLGHGVLAYADYDLEKAIELCKKTGSAESPRREQVECVGGTIMEIIGGGFHNPKLWAEQSKKYLSADDPLHPCSSDFIPDIARPQCYIYLTPHLFKVVGGSLGSPTPEDFEKAFLLCEKIPASDTASRHTCYGGFGKEFIVLAKNRDIRNIDKMTDEELAKVYEWCLLAKNQNGILACVNSAAASLYWGGENDRGIVIKFCGSLTEPNIQASCFANIIGGVSYYINDPTYRRGFCEELPPTYHEDCLTRLL